MKIFINGQAIEPEKVHGENLEEILRDIQDNHVSGSIVGDILVNGKSYQEDVPHAALEISHEEIQTLELTTRSVEEIAWHFIENGQNIVDSLINALPKIVELFRLGDETEANEHYLHFLESMQLLMNMIGYSKQALEINFHHEYGNQGSIEQKMERFSEVMSELLRIQEQNDWIYLADILEYELSRELNDLKTTLHQIKTKLH